MTHVCPEDVLVHLASLPTLKAITADFPPLPLQLATEVPHGAFPSLQHFSMVVLNLDDFIRRLASVTSTQLSSITARVQVKSTTASQVQQVLAEIRDRLAGALTAEVELGNVADAFENPENIPLPAETIHPLLGLPNLTRLKLSLHRYIGVDNVLLKTIVTSLPRLQTLELVHTPNTSISYPIRLTLGGLIPLATHCRELVTCALLVNATTVPVDFLKRPAGRYTSRVQRFNFAGSPIAQRYKVAAFLSDLFPELRDISSYDDDYDGWAEVSDSLKVFREVRKQERFTRD
ncbi:hypothetical protein B0H19DRAFT_1197640 [Mycena capillaripes]|nr:hypothetical protein B0H19DRAFT_1197640 [Mycena capillaripes]